MAKERKGIYYASMDDVPETLILQYGRKGDPHHVETYELDLDKASWVEVSALREAKPKRPSGGLRLEE